MRSFVIAALLPCAAVAQKLPAALIDRPLTLPAGATEFNVLFNDSSWSQGGGSVSGQAGAASIEYGFTSAVQGGVTVALPVSPGFSFGTVVGTGVFTASPTTALRIDAGAESVGSSSIGNGKYTLLFGGFGVPLKFRLDDRFAFVSGSAAAFRFAHFTNLGANGAALYEGTSTFDFAGADLFSVVHSTTSGVNGTVIQINAPIGVLLQIVEPLSVTLSTGYHALIATGGGTTGVSHYIPLGADVVLSPNPSLDIGVSLALAGTVSDASGANLGYGDIKNFALWVRLRSL
jgi:hypothetical protein